MIQRFDVHEMEEVKEYGQGKLERDIVMIKGNYHFQIEQ
jgi:hypothetical protein